MAIKAELGKLVNNILACCDFSSFFNPKQPSLAVNLITKHLAKLKRSEKRQQREQEKQKTS